jgi:hypothetical protein
MAQNIRPSHVRILGKALALAHIYLNLYRYPLRHAAQFNDLGRTTAISSVCTASKNIFNKKWQEFIVAAVAQPSVGAWTGSECVEIIELFYPQTLTTLSDYSEPVLD